MALTCIDFRFHRQVAEIFKKRGVEKFDLKCDAGGVKYLVADEKPEIRDWILENIKLAKELHHIETVILINHSDCGAYGGNEAFDSEESQFNYHKAQLLKAKTLVAGKFPSLKMQTYFALLKDGKVDLLAVD